MTTDAFKPRKRASLSDLKDRSNDPSDNFAPKRVVSMTFNMDEEWHKRFKMTATIRGLSMKELFEELFADYEKRHR